MFSGRRSNRSIALLTVLALVVLLVAPLIVNVHAATPIVFDAKSTATPCTTGPCAATLSWSHTVGSGVNRILIVSVIILITNPPLKTVSSITYGTSALTFIGSHSTNPYSEIEMWSLLSPPVGSALVTVTLAGSDDVLFAGSVSYFDVGGTHAFGAADGLSSGPLPSLTVNANSGDLVVDAVAMSVIQDAHGAFTNSPGSLQTERWSSSAFVPAPGADLFMGGSDQPASSPVTMTWTSTLTLTGGWIQVAVALTPLTIVPEYPLGLPLLAVFMIVGYGLIRRRTKVQ